MMDALKKMAPHAHWLLRIGLASVFLYHGAPKFGNLAGFSEMTGLPTFVAALVALAETGGGVLILLGALMKKEWMTQVAGLAMAVVMLGAIVMVHAPQGWNSVGEMGMEFQFTLLMTSLFFAFKGNGA